MQTNLRRRKPEFAYSLDGESYSAETYPTRGEALIIAIAIARQNDVGTVWTAAAGPTSVRSQIRVDVDQKAAACQV